MLVVLGPWTFAVVDVLLVRSVRELEVCSVPERVRNKPSESSFGGLALGEDVRLEVRLSRRRRDLRSPADVRTDRLEFVGGTVVLFESVVGVDGCGESTTLVGRHLEVWEALLRAQAALR